MLHLPGATSPRVPARAGVSAVLCCAIAGWAAMPGACAGSRDTPGPLSDETAWAGAGAGPDEGSPVHAIVVHPLTRIRLPAAPGADADRDETANGAPEETAPALVCHVEVRSTDGRPLRVLGTFRIALRPGVAQDAPGFASGEEVVWEVDAADEAANNRYFDELVTKTYTFVLEGVPDDVADWSRRAREGERGAQDFAPTVTVTLRTRDGEWSDSARVLR